MENLQKQYMEAEKRFSEQKANLFMKITKKLNVVIEKIAKQQKFDYIFNNAAVLWAPRYVDVTNEVIRTYNQSKS